MRPRVLVACERSGIVREAFRAAGCDAWSCDVEPAEDGSAFHLQCSAEDALALVYDPSEERYDWRTGRRDAAPWALLVAHPPYTYLCSSGLHWNVRRPGREAETARALAFARFLLDAPVPRVCVENPVGRIGTAIRPADQYVQPWQFGHDASKRTGLWLRGLPRLVATGPVIAPRMVAGRPRWGNQTDSGQNRLGPSERRAMERARTYPGIARAMAAQWAPLLKGAKHGG